MISAKELGARIRLARESQRITQEELAKTVNYGTASTISLIESGERGVSLEKLKEISDALGRDVDFFLHPKETEKDLTPTLAAAFRVSKNLDKDSQKNILNFVEFVKHQRLKKK